MVETKNVLDMGLNALFKAKDVADTGLKSISQDENEKISYLDISSLHPGKYQPRKFFDQDELASLASSIKQQGILQPLIVRKSETDSSYEIIAGERRWRASKIAGLDKVPTIIRNVDDSAAAAFAIIENVQRQDLNPVEEAESYLKLIKEFSLTHDEVAHIVGKSRASISNTLRLLNLNSYVLNLLKSSKLEMGHARAILGAPSDKQSDIANTVISHNYSVRQTEGYVNKLGIDESKNSARYEPSIDAKSLENKVSNALGTKAVISFKKNSSGRLVINFDSETHLAEIIKNIEKSVQ